MRSLVTRLCLILATAVVGWVAAGPASAHPHAFIAIKVAAVFENGKLVGLKQQWLFDDLYTQQALEGLKPGPDGTFGRKELAALAKTNMDGLQDFKYFTEIAGGDGKPLAFGAAKDSYMELVETKDAPGPDAVMGDAPPAADEPAAKVLALTFFLPLASPAAIDAKGVEVAITDPEIYIWFSFVRDGAISVESAPSCKAQQVAVGRLNDAYGPSGPTDGFKQSSFRIACGS